MKRTHEENKEGEDKNNGQHEKRPKREEKEEVKEANAVVRYYFAVNLSMDVARVVPYWIFTYPEEERERGDAMHAAILKLVRKSEQEVPAEGDDFTGNILSWSLDTFVMDQLQEDTSDSLRPYFKKGEWKSSEGPREVKTPESLVVFNIYTVA